MACLNYLSYERYNKPSTISTILDDEQHAFLRYAATFWYCHIHCEEPSPLLSKQVQQFVESPMFWHCVAVQCKVAPYLYTRYNFRGKKITYGTNIVRMPTPDLELYYASPMPSWMKSKHPQIVEDLLLFTAQWHHVLSLYTGSINAYVMDDIWTSRWPGMRAWQSSRIKSWVFTENSFPTDALFQEIVADNKHLQECLKFEPLEEIGIEQEACLLPRAQNLLDVRPDSSTSDNHTSTIQTLPIAKCAQQWKIMHVAPISHQDQIVAIQWSLSLSGEGQGGSNTDSDSLQSDRDSDCSQSDSDDDCSTLIDYEDDPDPANGAIADHANTKYDSLTRPLREPNCRYCIVVSHHNEHLLSYSWDHDQRQYAARCSYHPSRQLISWSPSSQILCIAEPSLSYSPVQGVYLPEPKVKFNLPRDSIVFKELYYSEIKDRLFYLLVIGTPGPLVTETSISVSYLKWITGEDGRHEMFPDGDPITLQCQLSERIDAAAILSTWTSSHIYISHHQMDSNQMIIRAPLSSGLRVGGNIHTTFEILHDPVFFPLPGLDRRLGLHYLERSQNSHVMALTIKSRPVIGDKNSRRAPQPTTVMAWEVDGDSAWRSWDGTVDTSLDGDQAAKWKKNHLRGTYIADDKWFDVPVRSGLNWRKKAYISCL